MGETGVLCNPNRKRNMFKWKTFFSFSHSFIPLSCRLWLTVMSFAILILYVLVAFTICLNALIQGNIISPHAFTRSRKHTKRENVDISLFDRKSANAVAQPKALNMHERQRNEPMACCLLSLFAH